MRVLPPTHELSRILVSVGIMLMIFASVLYLYLTTWLNSLLDNITKTEYNIIGNLSDHRLIANMSRDQQIDLLKQILNQTH